MPSGPVLQPKNLRVYKLTTMLIEQEHGEIENWGEHTMVGHHAQEVAALLLPTLQMNEYIQDIVMIVDLDPLMDTIVPWPTVVKP